MRFRLGQDWLVLHEIDGDDMLVMLRIMIAFQSACAQIWICLWNYDACQSLPCLTKWQRTTNWKCTSWGLPKSLFCIRAFCKMFERMHHKCFRECGVSAAITDFKHIKFVPVEMVHICNAQLRSHVVSSNRLWRPMAAPCNSETGWCWSYFCKRCIQCVHVKLTFFLTWRTCVCDDLQWRT